ncbi:MAG: Verru_Chthon cassette protein A [Verrucomicrobiota bacterium]
MSPPYRQKPPDHLLLDLFTMPIVEPYPISEPLSTAGRINMNTQIVPFTYIERNTGVRAVLKSERIIAIPDTDAGKYKNMSGTSVSYTANNYRLPINLDATLSEFDSYFSTNKDIFRSASQVCNIPLVPSQDVNGNGISLPFDAVGFWSTHRLTGDNSREKPYADIYPRLTTKSDTFMVHYDVQTLQKVTSSDPTVWDEAKDQVTGEYRGSTTIERYVDPNDTTLPDFADPSNATVALDKWYKFRVVSNKQFAP